MNQKKVKRIRRLANKSIPKDAKFAEHEYVPGNPDIGKRIESVGLERIVQLLGYAPVTSRLKPDCKKAIYKGAKNAS